MLYLVTGGSGSGKSKFAERLAVDRHTKEYSEGDIYYVATMYPYGSGSDSGKVDEETEKRINRHRQMRQANNFHTIECYNGLGSLKFGCEDVILLECMSNLLANEMYLEQGKIKSVDETSASEARTAIIEPVLELARHTGCVIIVSNEVFSDARSTYDVESERYIRLLAHINREIAEHSCCVTEVVCGIPLSLKGELPC